MSHLSNGLPSPFRKPGQPVPPTLTNGSAAFITHPPPRGVQPPHDAKTKTVDHRLSALETKLDMLIDACQTLQSGVEDTKTKVGPIMSTMVLLHSLVSQTMMDMRKVLGKGDGDGDAVAKKRITIDETKNMTSIIAKKQKEKSAIRITGAKNTDWSRYFKGIDSQKFLGVLYSHEDDMRSMSPYASTITDYAEMVGEFFDELRGNYVHHNQTLTARVNGAYLSLRQRLMEWITANFTKLVESNMFLNISSSVGVGGACKLSDEDVTFYTLIMYKTIVMHCQLYYSADAIDDMIATENLNGVEIDVMKKPFPIALPGSIDSACNCILKQQTICHIENTVTNISGFYLASVGHSDVTYMPLHAWFHTTKTWAVDNAMRMDVFEDANAEAIISPIYDAIMETMSAPFSKTYDNFDENEMYTIVPGEATWKVAQLVYEAYCAAGFHDHQPGRGGIFDKYHPSWTYSEAEWTPLRTLTEDERIEGMNLLERAATPHPIAAIRDTLSDLIDDPVRAEPATSLQHAAIRPVPTNASEGKPKPKSQPPKKPKKKAVTPPAAKSFAVKIGAPSKGKSIVPKRKTADATKPSPAKKGKRKQAMDSDVSDDDNYDDDEEEEEEEDGNDEEEEDFGDSDGMDVIDSDAEPTPLKLTPEEICQRMKRDPNLVAITGLDSNSEDDSDDTYATKTTGAPSDIDNDSEVRKPSRPADKPVKEVKEKKARPAKSAKEEKISPPIAAKKIEKKKPDRKPTAPKKEKEKKDKKKPKSNEDDNDNESLDIEALGQQLEDDLDEEDDDDTEEGTKKRKKKKKGVSTKDLKKRRGESKEIIHSVLTNMSTSLAVADYISAINRYMESKCTMDSVEAMKAHIEELGREFIKIAKMVLDMDSPPPGFNTEDNMHHFFRNLTRRLHGMYRNNIISTDKAMEPMRGPDRKPRPEVRTDLQLKEKWNRFAAHKSMINTCIKDIEQDIKDSDPANDGGNSHAVCSLLTILFIKKEPMAKSEMIAVAQEMMSELARKQIKKFA
jgi:hypothetical protein